MTRALFFVGPTKTSTTSIWHALKDVSDRDLQTLNRVLPRDMDLYERLESGATSGRQVRVLVNTSQAVG